MPTTDAAPVNDDSDILLLLHNKINIHFTGLIIFLNYLCTTPRKETAWQSITTRANGAKTWLREKGYEIIERDWRDGHRDIDIIARSPDLRTIVFVEVKTRATDVITKPEEAVDRRKIRNIGMAANTYVKMLNVLDELRFDVVSVIGGTKETAQVEHIVDAFNPCMAF